MEIEIFIFEKISELFVWYLINISTDDYTETFVDVKCLPAGADKHEALSEFKDSKLIVNKYTH